MNRTKYQARGTPAPAAAKGPLTQGGTALSQQTPPVRA